MVHIPSGVSNLDNSCYINALLHLLCDVRFVVPPDSMPELTRCLTKLQRNRRCIGTEGLTNTDLRVLLQLLGHHGAGDPMETLMWIAERTGLTDKFSLQLTNTKGDVWHELVHPLVLIAGEGCKSLEELIAASCKRLTDDETAAAAVSSNTLIFHVHRVDADGRQVRDGIVTYPPTLNVSGTMFALRSLILWCRGHYIYMGCAPPRRRTWLVFDDKMVSELPSGTNAFQFGANVQVLAYYKV